MKNSLKKFTKWPKVFINLFCTTLLPLDLPRTEKFLSEFFDHWRENWQNKNNRLWDALHIQFHGNQTSTLKQILIKSKLYDSDAKNSKNCALLVTTHWYSRAPVNEKGAVYEILRTSTGSCFVLDRDPVLRYYCNREHKFTKFRESDKITGALIGINLKILSVSCHLVTGW